MIDENTSQRPDEGLRQHIGDHDAAYFGWRAM